MFVEKLTELMGRWWPSGYRFARTGFRSLTPRTRKNLVRMVDSVSTPLVVMAGLLDVVPFVPALLPPRRPGSIPQGEALLVTMLVVSEVWRDPRVEREARALAAKGYRVAIVYPDTASATHPVGPIDWGDGIEFTPLPAGDATFAYRFPFLLGVGLFRAAIRMRPFAFHAHDLTTALIGLAAARTTRAHCVCDFHEMYSENVTWSVSQDRFVPHPAATRAVFRAVEKLALRRASAVITVCDSLAAELEALSGGRRTVDVVRNIPPATYRTVKQPTQVLLDQLGVSEPKFVLLYQGGVGPSRMLEPIIQAMAKVPRAIFLIRGPGIEQAGPSYRRLAAECGVDGRVFCLPPVPSNQVVQAAAGADAGIWTLPNLCKNFYYALPNKIFEYLSAGLPVLVAHYPEARRVVEGNGVGLCFDPYDPDSIAAQVNRLIDDPRLYEELRQAVPRALQSMSADAEWEKLAAIYERLRAETAA